MANNSWSGLTPKQDQIWEQLFEKHVPACGMAETVGGEILRAMTRIIYRFYNDGDMVGVGYGNETVNSSDRYLVNKVPDYVTLDQFDEYHEKEYETQMLKNHRTVFAYLQGKGQVLLDVNNTFDSRDASDEDYKRSNAYYREELDEDTDW